VDSPWLQRLRRAGAWLDASPAELGALAILLAGAVAVALFLVRGDAGALPALGPAIAPGDLAPSRAPVVLVVHVVGAVHTPGVVQLAEGARVADALEAAGGVTVDAALGGLNLARAVTDGEQLNVPRIGEQPTGVDAATPAGPVAGSPWTTDGKLDLNLASAADLEELPGIGPVLAARIVAWRDEHGGFKDVGELREVSGIGEKTFQNLSGLVVV